MGSDIDIKPMKPCHIDRTRSLRNQAMSLSKGKPLPYPSPRRPGGGSGGGSGVGVPGLGQEPLRVQGGSSTGQEPFRSPFFRQQKLPGAFQDVFKGLLEASCARDELRDPIWDRFLLPRGCRCTSKIQEFCETVHQILKLCAFRFESPFEFDVGPSRAPL